MSSHHFTVTIVCKDTNTETERSSRAATVICGSSHFTNNNLARNVWNRALVNRLFSRSSLLLVDDCLTLSAFQSFRRHSATLLKLTRRKASLVLLLCKKLLSKAVPAASRFEEKAFVFCRESSPRRFYRSFEYQAL